MGDEERIDIDESIVAELVAAQFPEWAGLPVRRVPWNGWDNTTFRLGDDKKVRLPTAAYYVAPAVRQRACQDRDGQHQAVGQAAE